MSFLTKKQLAHFQEKLVNLRKEVINDSRKMLNNLRDETREGREDGNLEASWIIECSLLTREQNLLNAIDAALERINSGEYGYCEQTGEPIDVDRLEAYPVTRLSAEAQQEQEKRRRFFYASPSSYKTFHRY